MEVEKALKELKHQFTENINSHVFLVETNDTEKSLESIKSLLAEILSKGDNTLFNQIITDNYLELIVIKSEGKMIKKERVYELQDRIKTKPIISDFIAYIIVPAEDLNEISSNKLLKTIEEPNPNTVGFLISKNSDLLLPTIKSRCERITLVYDEQVETKDISEEVLKLVSDLVMSIENIDHIKFYKTKLDKNIKESSQLIEKVIKDYYNMACNLKSHSYLDKNVVDYLKKKNSFSVLVRKTKRINLLMNKLSKNLNIDIFLESVFFEMKEVSQNADSRS